MDNRMQFHHHKYALTLTILFVAAIGVLLGIQVDHAAGGHDALVILTFSFLLLLLVVGFITVSMLLRVRDDMHILHEELLDCVNKKGGKRKR